MACFLSMKDFLRPIPSNIPWDMCLTIGRCLSCLRKIVWFLSLSWKTLKQFKTLHRAAAFNHCALGTVHVNNQDDSIMQVRVCAVHGPLA